MGGGAPVLQLLIRGPCKLLQSCLVSIAADDKGIAALDPADRCDIVRLQIAERHLLGARLRAVEGDSVAVAILEHEQRCRT